MLSPETLATFEHLCTKSMNLAYEEQTSLCFVCTSLGDKIDAFDTLLTVNNMFRDKELDPKDYSVK